MRALLALALALCALLCAGCKRETILFQDCVIYAANLKVAEDARRALDRSYLSDILLIQTNDAPVGHAYFVFALGGKLMAYDADGSRVVNLPPERFQEYPVGIAVQLVGAGRVKTAKFAFYKP